MRLAPGYIYEHEYLFTEPQTINFGGKYLYDLELNDKNPYLTRSSNPQFLADFYITTEYETKIELVINMTSIKPFLVNTIKKVNSLKHPFSKLKKDILKNLGIIKFVKLYGS